MIILIVIIAILVPCLIWDFYAHYKFPRKDESVSEYIYRFVHRFPIVMFAAGMVLTYFFHTIEDIEIILIGILLGHLSWKA